MKKTFWVLAPLLSILALFYWFQFRPSFEVVEHDFDSSHIYSLQDFYSTKVQPIFDAKCIACHACYNSPCQLNLTSYEGIIRGANQLSIYDFPATKGHDPTRLFIDAHTQEEWRQKKFYTVINTENPDESILNYMINYPYGIESQKQEEFLSEQSRACTPFLTEMQKRIYETANPAGRMPFGLPPLTKEEIETIQTWQTMGAHGPNLQEMEKSYRDHESIKYLIHEWETFFNRSELKSQIASRYLYEHLFLAHIYFDKYPNIFFRLVRSKKTQGPIEELGTTYPFDHPGQDFTYRLRPVTNTITHKEHIPFALNSKKMKQWNEDFYLSKWRNEPTQMPDYGRAGANPYVTFSDIPVNARYQLFLDDAAYFLMTFIKGPVCRGQVALNVINDHFWVFFVDPSKDILIKYPHVYDKVASSMTLPAEIGDDFKPLMDFRQTYWDALHYKYEQMENSKESLSLDWIWPGNDSQDTNAALTVYRHFDSANIIRGLRGRTPKTAFLIDYHVFESIYYNLAASYNVFGPLLHQINSRLFMEISRIASEDLFITMLPKESRHEIRTSWNLPGPQENQSIGKKIVELLTEDVASKMEFHYSYPGDKINSTVKINPKQAKEELLEKIIDQRLGQAQLNNQMDNHLESLANLPGSIVRHLPDTILLRLNTDDGKREQIYTLVHNKEHYNISMLFFESNRRRPEHDNLDVIPGVVTSYANYFMVLTHQALKEFTNELKKASDADEVNSLLKRYGINRNHPDFWEHYRWFSHQTRDVQTNEKGWLDLNRYNNL